MYARRMNPLRRTCAEWRRFWVYRYLAPTVPGQLESMSQSLPTQLKVLQAISEVPEAAWNALVDEEAAPFLEWRWLEALEGSGSVAETSGWEPRHLTLWRGHRLVAAAPAYRKSDSSDERKRGLHGGPN